MEPVDGELVKSTGSKTKAIVIGASSGMGASLVRQLVREGHEVGGVARRGEALASLAQELDGEAGRLVHRAHDVTDAADAPGVFDELVAELGGLDLFIYAAGVMPDVGPEEYDTEKDLAMVDVNLGGCVTWTNLAARLFHTQRSGTIVGIGSIAGDRGRKGAPVYGATKAALATYFESLRNRLAERRVKVVTVKPGMIETPMTAHLDELMMPVSAERAAADILKAARGRAFDVRHVPLRWLPVSLIIRTIPSFLFRRMSI